MPQPSLARNRQELSAFVRRHREQLTPGEVGLPNTGRRRTSGLRREEVAALAGVGLTWYTWFEQGREVNVSTAFVDNVARALNLNPAARAHLLSLTGHSIPEQDITLQGGLPPAIRSILENMGSRPAYVKDARWHILAWNAAAAYVFGDFGRHPARERNTLWLTFTDSTYQRSMSDWELDARRIVAKYRLIHAKLAHDPGVRELVSDLEKVSPDFKRFWREHEVQERANGMRRVNVPTLGAMNFEYVALRVEGITWLTLMVYLPEAGDPNTRRFTKLCARLPMTCCSDSIIAEIAGRAA